MDRVAVCGIVDAGPIPAGCTERWGAGAAYLPGLENLGPD